MNNVAYLLYNVTHLTNNLCVCACDILCCIKLLCMSIRICVCVGVCSLYLESIVDVEGVVSAAPEKITGCTQQDVEIQVSKVRNKKEA